MDITTGTDFLKATVRQALVVVFLFLIICIFIRQYLARRLMPPGPMPLPLLGNLLEFICEKNAAQIVEKYHKKYGAVITLWLGTIPVVFICDFAMAKDAVNKRKSDFAGRIQHQLVADLKGAFHDVVLEDFGPQWQMLKKIGIKALRKYTDGENLAIFVHESTERAIEMMLMVKKAFNPTSYLFNLVGSVLASTTFGESFQMDDPDFLAMCKLPDVLGTKFPACLPGYLLPMLKPFFEKSKKDFLSYATDFMAIIKKRLLAHRNTYNHSNIRDFVDAVILMHEGLKTESPKNSITEEWLIGLIANVFLAGIDTTQISLSFSVLMMCSYPEIQEEIRKEIAENIGDRMPVQSDRSNCHYTQAFISEILRLKRTGPFGLPHATTAETEIGGYTIPSRTPVVFFVEGFHMDEKAWDRPSDFRPERFLDSDGRFISSGVSHYMPFGMGRRMCMGEKMARIDLFLVLAGLLQKCQFRLENGPGSADLDMVYSTIFNIPKPYKLFMDRIERS